MEVSQAKRLRIKVRFPDGELRTLSWPDYQTVTFEDVRTKVQLVRPKLIACIKLLDVDSAVTAESWKRLVQNSVQLCFGNPDVRLRLDIYWYRDEARKEGAHGFARAQPPPAKPIKHSREEIAEKRASLANVAPRSTGKDLNASVREFENALQVSLDGVAKFVQTFVNGMTNALENDFANLNVGPVHVPLAVDTPSTCSPIKQPEQQVPRISFIESPHEPPVTHYGVVCDHCFNIIRGRRFKCRECGDYDLCSKCYRSVTVPHTNWHRFSSISHPGGFPDTPFPRPQYKPKGYNDEGKEVYPGPAVTTSSPCSVIDSPPVHSAICDLCNKGIKGTRHKCVQCPDFDLCDSCRPKADHEHPRHGFVKIVRPQDYEAPRYEYADKMTHPNVVCNDCQNHIAGIRYKCTGCDDFDLCENCEALPTLKKAHPGHDVNHVFLKLRRPIKGGGWDTPQAILPSLRMVDIASEKAPVGERAPVSSKVDSQPPVPFKAICRTIPMSTSKPNDDGRVCNKPASINSPSVFGQFGEVPNETSINNTSPFGGFGNKTTKGLSASFVEDVNISDGTRLRPRTRFLKMWKMRNDGSVSWPQGTQVQHCGGDNMSIEGMKSLASFEVPMAKESEEVFVTADLQAPTLPGHYVSYWRLVTADGKRFGHRLWCDIIVEDEPSQDMDSSFSAGSTASMVFPAPNTFQESEHEPEKASVPDTPRSTFTAVSHATSSSRPLLTEDPFRDPPSYVPSNFSAATSEADDSDHEATKDADENPSQSTSVGKASGPLQSLQNTIGIFGPVTTLETGQMQDTHSLLSSPSASSISSETSFGSDFVFVDDLEEGHADLPSWIHEKLPSGDAEKTMEQNLTRLAEMGFHDEARNRDLLNMYSNDMDKVINALFP